MLTEKIRESLHASRDLYHQLVLLVGGSGTGKTTVLQNVAGELGVSVINANLALSSELLELSPRHKKWVHKERVHLQPKL